MVPFAGFEMPVQYTGIRQEHRAVREACGLFDVSHMGEIRVQGPKAQAALQWLLSNGVLRVSQGQAQYNILCNHQGGVVDDVFLYRLGEEDFLVCVNAANRAKDAAWFMEHNPFPEAAKMTDEGDAWAQLAIQGPAAVHVVAALAEDDCAQLARRHHLEGTFAGVAGCIIARTGYTGEDGFEVFIPSAAAGPVWDLVMEAGKPHGLEPIGLGARDTLRLEAGNCLYGHEIDDETSPIQAGLGWVVKI
jgi:aminomethyltransferase